MSLLGKAADPQFWADLKNNEAYKPMVDAVLSEYEKFCIGEVETTKFSKFRLFKDIGDRNAYQQTFFHRQHRAYAMIFMCLLYPENEKYLELLQDTIWEICDQYVWALPAHIDNIEVNDNCEMDLDATTMAMVFAIAKEVLGDRLHPLIKSRIDYEIDRRIIKPFMAKRWHWEYRANNWTAVCSGATGCVFMLNRPELFELVRDRINENMADYLRSYYDDGVCVEGAGYWSYGFGYYMEYARMQKEFTKGRYNFVDVPKVKNISMFLQRLFLDRDVIVNYGDCGSNVTVPAGFMYGLRSVYGTDVDIPPQERLTYDVHYFPAMLRAFTDFDTSFTNAEISKEATYYMGDYGWFVKRCEKFGLGARGGSNGESHNHNDVGSFILAIDNEQVLIDMGGRPYTRQYFEDGKRYTFLETSSRGHNLPIINGEYQKNIRNTGSTTSYENGVFSVEFSSVYGIEGLKNLTRDYSFTDTSVTVTDTLDISGNFTLTERLVSYKEPIIKENEVIVGKAHIKFDKDVFEASYAPDIHTLECEVDGSAKRGVTVYLIDLKLKTQGKSNSFTIEIE